MDQDPQRSLQFCHLHLAPPPAAVELGLESVTVLTEDVECEEGNVTVFLFFFYLFLFPGSRRVRWVNFALRPDSRVFTFKYSTYLTGCRDSNLSCCDRSQVCYQWHNELHTSLLFPLSLKSGRTPGFGSEFALLYLVYPFEFGYRIQSSTKIKYSKSTVSYQWKQDELNLTLKC